MISHWKTFLQENAARWGLPKSGEWSFLFNNNYHPHCSTLNLLWFHDGGKFPRVVAKVFHDPGIPQREFGNLKQAHGCAPAWVPRPLHFGAIGDFWILWMEGVPGSPLQARSRYAPAVLRSVVEAIASIHSAIRGAGGVPSPERHHRLITEPLETVAQFGDSEAIREGCARVAGESSAEWLAQQAVIPQHGDLFRSNLLSYRGDWHVIDWEIFGMVDLPLYDLLTLLCSLLLETGEAPDRWDVSLARQVPGLIDCYAQRLALASRDVTKLLPLTLANWFHLQWSDGRQEFCRRMYKTIQHYFEYHETWDRVFRPTQALSEIR